MIEVAPGPALLAAYDVHHGYGELEVLAGVAIELRANERTAIVGPSGGGKSTLPRLLAGLESATAGRIQFRGAQGAAPTGDRSLMFQSGALYPWMSLLDNVAFAPCPGARHGRAQPRRWRTWGWRPSGPSTRSRCRAACASAQR